MKNKINRNVKGKLTIECFQNPLDLAVHEKKFISRGFKIKKNLSSQSNNFSKKKNTLKNFKKPFLAFFQI